MADLGNKVAVVTGASKGIGAGIAERLARDGASVIVNYARAYADAAAVVARIEAAGGNAVAVRADLSDPAQASVPIDAAIERFGRLNILVNNAGVYKPDTLDTITPTSFAEHYDLNVRGLLLSAQAAARVLPAGGVIVNVSSGLAKSPFPNVQVYCSTKGAVDVLTRTMGMELGSRGIRVVGIAPGFVATEGNADSRESAEDYLIGRTPLGRIGRPDDIAKAVAFVVSNEAEWITATTIDVAGGLVF